MERGPWSRILSLGHRHRHWLATMVRPGEATVHGWTRRGLSRPSPPRDYAPITRVRPHDYASITCGVPARSLLSPSMHPKFWPIGYAHGVRAFYRPDQLITRATPTHAIPATDLASALPPRREGALAYASETDHTHTCGGPCVCLHCWPGRSFFRCVRHVAGPGVLLSL